MRFPHFPSSIRRRVDLPMGGLLPADTAHEGDFLDTRNMLIEHGVLSVHPSRKVLIPAVQGRGLTVVQTEAGEQLCYVAGGDLWVGEQCYPLSLTDTDHRLIPFGGRLLIFPERKYLSLRDGSHGTLDAAVTTSSATLFTLCHADGTPMTPLTTSAAAPQAPAHGDLWLDTAFRPAVLRHYSAAREEWQTVTETYLRLSCVGIGHAFRPNDTVSLTGIVPTELSALNGLHRLVDCHEDYLVIAATPCVTLRQVAPLTVTRRLPGLDPETVMVLNDRLMGAATEVGEDGSRTTVICACRPGDPFNWETDEKDSDGARRWLLPYTEPITASAVYRDQPYFFTAHGVLHLSGQGASAHWQMLPIEGIQQGCGRSLQAVGRYLYYYTGHRAVLFDGERITPLPPIAGEPDTRTAAAGVLDARYYLSLTDTDGRGVMLIYQSEDKIWSRLDATRAECFAPFAGGLCYRDGCDGAIRAITATAEGDTDTAWAAESSPIYLRDALGRLCYMELTLMPQVGTQMQILIGCDGTPARQVVTEICAAEEAPVTVRIYPRAVSHFTIRLQGMGEMRLTGWSKIIK